jgi:kinesin family protein 18/19
VRCRPFSKKESESGQKSIIVSFQENLIVLLDPTSETVPEEAFRLNRSKEKQFAFDIVIDSAASQLDVFGKTTSFLIEGVLNGYNATVFAYGATGAGKTFT